VGFALRKTVAVLCVIVGAHAFIDFAINGLPEVPNTPYTAGKAMGRAFRVLLGIAGARSLFKAAPADDGTDSGKGS